MIKLIDLIVIVVVLILNIVAIRCCYIGDTTKGLLCKVLGDGISLVFVCIHLI